MDGDPQATRCPTCGQTAPSPATLAYRDAHWRSALLRETPPEVWTQYAADGIGLAQAVTMEMSYAG